METVDGVSILESAGNGEEAQRGRVLELALEVSIASVRTSVLFIKSRRVKTGERRVNHADSLLDDLLELSADGHNLTNRLHRRSERVSDTVELLKIPTRHLGDDVIKGRLEACSGSLGDGVADHDEILSKSKLGGNICERVAGSLGSESGRAGETSIDFNNAVAHRGRVESVLNVTLTNDTKVANDLESGLTKHEVLIVGKSLRRGNDDRVTGVDTERVEVFHVTHGHTVVLAIANNFVLNLLPSAEILVDNNLVRCRECLLTQRHKLVHIFSETRTKTTKSEGGTNQNGKSNLLGSSLGLIHSVSRDGHGSVLVNLSKLLGKGLAVLSIHDDRDRRSQDTNVVALKLSALVELDTNVEGSLTTHRHQDGVRTLLLDYTEDSVGCDGEKVDLVSEVLTGLNGGDVWVNEDNLDRFLFEGLNGLTSRVIELTGLADGKTSGTNKNTLAYRLHLEHDGGYQGVSGHLVANTLEELIKEKGGVHGTSAGLRVKLNREVRLALVNDTFVGHVVGVHEQRLPAGRKSLSVHSISVVLRGDVALGCAKVNRRLVSTTVTEAHLVGLGSGSKSEKLVTEADTKDGDRCLATRAGLAFHVHHLADVLNRSGGHSGVTRSVTDEETIELAIQCVNVVVIGEDSEFNATAEELADNVVLHTAVVGSNARASTGIEDLDLGRRDLSDEVDLVWVIELDRVLGNFDLTECTALFAENLGEHAGVNAVKSRDSGTAEPGAKALSSVPVRVGVRVVRNDETGNLDLVALVELGNSELIFLVTRHTVVANERVGEDENLATVRRVSERLRVADHTGVEDNLSSDALVSTEGESRDLQTVLKGELGSSIRGLEAGLLAFTGDHDGAVCRRKTVNARHLAYCWFGVE
mmetsp:Transcript_3258/g.5531  ORF Transcript_3258/g.5531 Transcript_3258/m.5531 type:complete len:870 (+) Transcript_3258:2518-5127(+)